MVHVYVFNTTVPKVIFVNRGCKYSRVTRTNPITERRVLDQNRKGFKTWLHVILLVYENCDKHRWLIKFKSRKKSSLPTANTFSFCNTCGKFFRITVCFTSKASVRDRAATLKFRYQTWSRFAIQTPVLSVVCSSLHVFEREPSPHVSW